MARRFCGYAALLFPHGSAEPPSQPSHRLVAPAPVQEAGSSQFQFLSQAGSPSASGLGHSLITSKVRLPLLARQFWSSSATVITIAASVWLLILFVSWGEEYSSRLLRSHNL